MRKARTIALTTGASELTPTFVAEMTTSAPAALAARTSRRRHRSSAVTDINPAAAGQDAEHAGTTERASSQLVDALHGPDQIRAEYNVRTCTRTASRARAGRS